MAIVISISTNETMVPIWLSGIVGKLLKFSVRKVDLVKLVPRFWGLKKPLKLIEFLRRFYVKWLSSGCWCVEAYSSFCCCFGRQPNWRAALPRPNLVRSRASGGRRFCIFTSKPWPYALFHSGGCEIGHSAMRPPALSPPPFSHLNANYYSHTWTWTWWEWQRSVPTQNLTN